jgi:hypothetical protein
MVLPTEHSETRFTEPNRIHILPTGFAPLNAFVICEDRKRVINLRIATAQDPDLKPEAIMKVVKLFPENERESMQWIFLFVGPKKYCEAITQNPDKLVNVDGVEIDVCVGWITVSTIDEFRSKVLVSPVIVSRGEWWQTCLTFLSLCYIVTLGMAVWLLPKTLIKIGHVVSNVTMDIDSEP